MLEAVGIVYLCALVGLAVGLAVSPGHSYRGRVATLDIFALFISGTVLAIRAVNA